MDSILSFFRQNNVIYFVVATWLFFGIFRLHILKESIFERKTTRFDTVISNLESVCLEHDFIECLNLKFPTNSRIYVVKNRYSSSDTNILTIVPQHN